MSTPSAFEPLLEYQANQIETVLTHHRAPCRVIGGTVTPRWVCYQIVPDISTKVAHIMALSEEVALRLNAPDVRVTRQGAWVHAIELDLHRRVKAASDCRRHGSQQEQTGKRKKRTGLRGFSHHPFLVVSDASIDRVSGVGGGWPRSFVSPDR